MEVFKPEIHSFFFRPILDDAREVLGPERLGEILETLGVSEAQLRDDTAWLSLAFSEALLERISEEQNDPTMLDRVMRRATSPEYLGALYPFLRSFGTPLFTFTQLAKSSPRFNKVGRWSTAKGTGRSIVLRYQPLPDAPRERTALFCAGRASQFKVIPTLFDLAPAVVAHPKCMTRGDEACVYEVSWTEPPKRWPHVVAASGGAALGAGLGLVIGATGPVVGVLTVAGLVTGWALATRRSLAREVKARKDDIVNHHDALTRITRDNEKRFAELLQAKAEVEQKVEERTAELQEASRQLEFALAEVRALDEAKTNFFANVSHELRTPLTLILGPLEEIRAGREPTGGLPAAVGIMHRNATRLLTLINQLLDLAKVDAGAIHLSRVPVNPIELAESVLEAFQAAAAVQDVGLKVESPKTVRPLSLDPSWVESAITNLVANALRFSPAGTTITVRVLDRGADLVIQVQDQGRGIPAEELDQVFERFAQTDADSAKRVGTGLGLAIVRETARLHDGEATVESTVGVGTTFTLTFPRLHATPRVPPSRPPGPVSTPPFVPPAVVAAAHAEAKKVADRRSGPHREAPLALVVEDNPDLRSYIADVLSARYRVETATHGQHGLEKAIELQPHVIVSDVAMPVMDGFELCREVRRRPDMQTVPFLLVTAHGDVGRILEGFDAGADDYVTKPFHGRELLARVDVHVRLRQMVREMAHRERLAMLGTVAASVAHQVRNPLTSIMSGLPAIRQRLGTAIDQPTDGMFSVMLDCAGRIERMTLDLLDLSRVDRAQRAAFSPGDGLEATLRVVTAGIGARVVVESEVFHDALLWGRAADLNHVFLNLIDNAVRALDGEGTVRVHSSVEEGTYVVLVDDSGPGIPPEERKRVFDPFWSTRAAGQGTGLGLAIAHHVVEDHGGSITISDSPLGGARFEVRIPGATLGEVVLPSESGEMRGSADMRAGEATHAD